jgi:hypothetical protein
MKHAVLAAAAAMFVCTPALADERWTSTIGDIIYEAEIDGVAIFTYPTGDGSLGRLYMPGLAGNYENRASHLGYWIAPGDGGCLATMTGADGMSSKNWGQLLLIFHTPGYPASWTLTSGSCFEPMINSVVATPMVDRSLGEPAPAPEGPAEPPPPPPPKN